VLCAGGPRLLNADLAGIGLMTLAREGVGDIRRRCIMGKFFSD